MVTPISRYRTFSIALISAFFLVLLFRIGPTSAAEITAVNSKVIRLAVVNTPQFSGLIDFLLEDFKKTTGLSVEVHGGDDVYERARAGKADIVISHYGKREVKRFVLDGFGTWPEIVFSNQAALIGPKSDPANIRGLSRVSLALTRIAKTKSPFIANAIPGVAYLSNIAWDSAGRSRKGAWYLDTGVARAQAIRLAEKKQGYVIWGAYPFLRYKRRHDSTLEILISGDPLLQRIMAIVLVNPKKISGVNFKGAARLRDYLLSPRTQAKIAAFRSPGSDRQLWWPGGRNNHTGK